MAGVLFPRGDELAGREGAAGGRTGRAAVLLGPSCAGSGAPALLEGFYWSSTRPRGREEDLIRSADPFGHLLGGGSASGPFPERWWEAWTVTERKMVLLA